MDAVFNTPSAPSTFDACAVTSRAPSSDALEVTLAATLRRQALPPRLRAAVDHAVFGGAARLRPRLCLAVYGSFGGRQGAAVLALASAVELLHCASLIHDDLPCFDAALLRRGRPTVHCAFGEGLAVLAGDALIVAAFAACSEPGVPAAARREVARGAARLVAGQGLESEPQLDMRRYHAQKTGSLFGLAASCGARCAGADPRPWRRLGQTAGLAYQLADDLHDGREDGDGQTGQPNWAQGSAGAPTCRRRLRRLLGRLHQQAAGCADLPDLVDRSAVAAWCRQLAARLQF